MNQVSENNRGKCPSCGFINSGNYCINCGAQLVPGTYGAFLDFVYSFLKISEVISYATTLITILSSPTNKIITYYEEEDARKAFLFLAYSATVWFLIALSKIWVIREQGLIATIIFALQFVIFLSVSISIFYKLSVRESPYSRTFHEFLIISSFYVGVSIVLAALVTYIQLIAPIIWFIAILLVFIPAMIFTFGVLEYFWGLSMGRILLYAIISSLSGGAIGTLFFVLCAHIFDIRVT